MKRYPESSAGRVTGRIFLKKLVPLFAALLVVGCGEKSSSEGSDSTGASAEPSADAVKPVPTESPGKEPSPPLLSDAEVERLLKEAVDVESLDFRDIYYHDDKPYSGWAKEMSIYDSGQAKLLMRLKDGKRDGPSITWHENGQKSGEGTLKDGRPHGLWMAWHENGQKALEGTFKDGEEVSVTYWNSTGEEVETEEEALE